MRRLLLVATTTAIILAPTHVVAGAPAIVRGGGTGTFGSDLDGDGDIDGSQFGMGVAILGGGSASGRFLCLMAGQSDIGPFPVMSVSGRIATGSLTGDSSATFGGTATVNLGNGLIFRNVPFEVSVTEGGPGDGTLQLTVIGVFNGGPGDTIDNGDYDLPVETVASGQIVVG